jgi:polyhydroxyalkanoic acid synthase PhaR subunit
MTTPPDNPAANANPFEVWKQIYEANERAWNSALERALAAPNFAEAQGRLLESLLAAQKTVRDNTRSFLQAMNVPTREDITHLGELITGLEEKIDQLDDRLLSIEKRLAARDRRPAGTGRAPKARGT